LHQRTLVILVVLVAVLAAVALWLVKQEPSTVQAGPRPLVPGLAREDVESIRVDNLERSVQLAMRQAPDGTWRIHDPIDYPVEGALMNMFFDALLATQAERREGDLAGLGLLPPRAVIELTQRTSSGTKTHRIELGATDVDAQHVFARVDGEIVRTLRNLESLLDRPLPEWRSHILWSLAPTAIVELERSGKYPAPGTGEPMDLGLRAVMDERWRATEPFQAALAPEAIGTLLTSLAYLRIASFESDAPGPLEHYDLDPPHARIQVTTAQGETLALRFAFLRDSDRVRCMREGSPHIYKLAQENVAWLFAPAERLVDRELLRAPRDRITRLVIERPDARVTFEREGVRWFVSAEGERALPREKADGESVADLLAALESARIAEVLPGREFPADAGADSLAVRVTVDGEDRGGRLGAVIDGPNGTRGRAFLRDGDTLVGLVESDLSQLQSFDPALMRSRELHKVSELELVQAHVEASWAQKRRQWQRNDAGRWSPEGSDAEARDFAALMDQLLTARASRFLDAQERPAGVRPIAVSLLDRNGKHAADFQLSLLEGDAAAPESATVLYESAERKAVVDGRLYFSLAELLGL
jgi:hypothetical protein